MDGSAMVYAAVVALFVLAAALLAVAFVQASGGRRRAAAAWHAGISRSSVSEDRRAGAPLTDRPRILAESPLGVAAGTVAGPSVEPNVEPDAVEATAEPPALAEPAVAAEPTIPAVQEATLPEPGDSIEPRRLTLLPRRGAIIERPAERTPSAIATSEPAADRGTLVDPATGVASLEAWEENLVREDHRVTRYRRPVTVVVAELDGLDALAARLGREAADNVLASVASTLRRSARASDYVARGEGARFLVLLPETDEVAATNYVERVRSACDLWLAAGGAAVRLALGWASPTPGTHLSDALKVAEGRMEADRKRSDFRVPVAFPEPLAAGGRR